MPVEESVKGQTEGQLMVTGHNNTYCAILTRELKCSFNALLILRLNEI